MSKDLITKYDASMSTRQERRETERTDRILNAYIALPPAQGGQTVASIQKHVVQFAKGRVNEKWTNEVSID